MEKQLEAKKKQLQGTRGKLANESFTIKAPAEVVQQQRELADDLEKQIASIETNLAELRQA